tara:strand:- start:328 stop:642 length:315 start_codon:yes stop_codon:yes gene_type:complete
MNSKFNPTHYQGSIEPWDFIVAQKMDFLTGNIIKYLTRAGKKDNESKLDDLLKAQVYLRKLISTEVNEDSTGSSGTSDQVPTDHESTDWDLYPEWFGHSTQFDR